MKRFIAFIIAFILVMALPLSISAALPPNDTNISYDLKDLYISSDRGYANQTDSGNNDYGNFHFGELYHLQFNAQIIQPYDDIETNFDFIVELDFPSDTDLYIVSSLLSGDIPVYPIHLENLDTGEVLGLADHFILTFDALSSYTIIPYYYNTTYHYIFESNSYISDLSSQVKFFFAGSIPAGRYFLKLSNADPFTASVGRFTIGLGIYADVHSLGNGNPILDYQYGLISFQEASQLIRDNMDSVLDDDTMSDSQKQFAIAVANNQLNQLQNISNEKFSSTVDNFESLSESIVQDYYSEPTTDILPVINDLNKIYTDTLTQATSPEQGMLINAQYSVKLAQLQAGYQVAYKEELEGVLSDEDMQHKQDSYDQTDSALAVEDEALDIFRESDYQSQLAFDNWLNQFSQYGDITVYRSIFEFFFEDPSTVKIQPFMTIPFSLVLVGVLLATTTVVFNRRSQ